MEKNIQQMIEKVKKLVNAKEVVVNIHTTVCSFHLNQRRKHSKSKEEKKMETKYDTKNQINKL